MRFTLLLLIVLPLHVCAQSVVDTTYALELISRLENDPLHGNYRTDMQLIFRWMDETADLLQLMNHPDLNRIANSKRDYRRQMQLLYLGGMIRYLLSHPELPHRPAGKVNAEGRSCMCIGYANLRKKHKVRSDFFIRRLCRKS